MSTRRLILHEDRFWRLHRPLTDLLPVPALAFGASDLARRWIARAGLPLFAIEARSSAMACWLDAPVRDTAAIAADDEAVVVNAAALPGDWFDAVLADRSPALFLCEGRVAAARLPLAMLRGGIGRGEDFETVLLGLALPTQGCDATFLDHPWDLMQRNPDAIVADLVGRAPSQAGSVHRLAALEAPERIVIEAGATVGPFAVLEATDGPILVARGARIEAHSIVRGPCVVGPGTWILGGSVSGTTFGPECRIAGEVEACLWQGFGNKRHHGFVGHSVLGEWVNLGALTTTSDLKNNYGKVRVRVEGQDVDTGSPKIGAFIGAHVKTGIGSLLPTGASIGTAANLFGGGRFAPKHVAPFTWWDGTASLEHELERMLATARIATSRRGQVLTPAHESAIRALHAATAVERARAAGA